MIFYTADLHLGYFPILHDTARPFTGVPEMDEALISNWNARVGADDSVYIVGDFSYNGGEAPTGQETPAAACSACRSAQHTPCLKTASSAPPSR